MYRFLPLVLLLAACQPGDLPYNQFVDNRDNCNRVVIDSLSIITSDVYNPDGAKYNMIYSFYFQRRLVSMFIADSSTGFYQLNYQGDTLFRKENLFASSGSSFFYKQYVGNHLLFFINKPNFPTELICGNGLLNITVYSAADRDSDVTAIFNRQLFDIGNYYFITGS